MSVQAPWLIQVRVAASHSPHWWTSMGSSTGVHFTEFWASSMASMALRPSSRTAPRLAAWTIFGLFAAFALVAKIHPEDVGKVLAPVVGWAPSQVTATLGQVLRSMLAELFGYRPPPAPAAACVQGGPAGAAGDPAAPTVVMLPQTPSTIPEAPPLVPWLAIAMGMLAWLGAGGH